ncbi:MAG: hypothetical protein IPM29_27590 [Planctomycetes bacterium]|nr:hypothetical protein [Planctomycetota bacterium]
MSAEPGSLVAAERAEPLLQFAWFRKLGYGARTRWALVLAAGGVILQVATLSVWIGVPLLVAALLMTWVVGFDVRTDPRGFRSGAAWESCAFDRVQEILLVDGRMRRWDESALDITSGAGVVSWLVALLVLGIATVAAGSFSADLAWIVGMDGVLLLASQWFSGMRTVSRKPDLVLQARSLKPIGEALQIDGRTGGKLGAQLLMAGGDERRTPIGVKLAVTFPDGPAAFYGLQAQVVINRVQGTPYPYCYAVLVARSGARLFEATAHMKLPNGVVRETQRKDDIDVVIVRQKTTKTAGYHTPPTRSLSIVQAALDAAEAYVRKAVANH